MTPVVMIHGARRRGSIVPAPAITSSFGRSHLGAVSCPLDLLLIQAAVLAFNCLFTQTKGGAAPSSSFKNLIPALWCSAGRRPAELLKCNARKIKAQDQEDKCLRHQQYVSK